MVLAGAFRPDSEYENVAHPVSLSVGAELEVAFSLHSIESRNETLPKGFVFDRNALGALDRALALTGGETDQKIATQNVVADERGVTVSQLLDAVDCRGGISDDTFRRMRKAAGIESPRGRAGANRRYTPDEMDRIYIAVRDGNFDHRVEVMRAWAPFTRSSRQ